MNPADHVEQREGWQRSTVRNPDACGTAVCWLPPDGVPGRELAVGLVVAMAGAALTSGGERADSN